MRKIMLLLYMFGVISATAAITEESDDLRIRLEVPEIVADGQTINRLRVYQTDGQGTGYSGFNLELVLPEGFTLNKLERDGTLENDILLSERGEESHRIAGRFVGGSTLRIISYSPANEEYGIDSARSEEPGCLFSVGLIADKSLSAGEYTARLEGVKFAKPDADAVIPAGPLEFPFTVAAETLTVGNPDIEDADSKEYYDLHGRKTDPAANRNTVIVGKGTKILVK